MYGIPYLLSSLGAVAKRKRRCLQNTYTRVRFPSAPQELTKQITGQNRDTLVCPSTRIKLGTGRPEQNFILVHGRFSPESQMGKEQESRNDGWKEKLKKAGIWGAVVIGIIGLINIILA